MNPETQILIFWLSCFLVDVIILAWKSRREVSAMTWLRGIIACLLFGPVLLMLFIGAFLSGDFPNFISRFIGDE